MATPRRLALVAAHDLNQAAVYWTLLDHLDYEVRVARDGDEARQLVLRHGVPELLVADVWLAKTDGIGLVRLLRRDAPKHRMGVVMFSTHARLREMARDQMGSLGIASVLPPDADQTTIREAIQTAQPHPSALQQKDRATLERMAELAGIDELTELPNRRGVDEKITAELSRAKRNQAPVSCIYFDIDRFREINTTYGHPEGDRVLRELGEIFRKQVREYDILGRLGEGADEFLILVSADLEQARQLAERIRHAVAVYEFTGIRPVTISGGVATNDVDYDFKSMYAQADRRQRQAKKDGGNRIDSSTP
jgi:diguanylate cyclase (GGDEF)-like protein